jgi:DNA polymerase-1
MINVNKRLRESGLDACLLLQVHDELLIESSRDCADAVLSLLKSEMENAFALSVPLKVEANIGENWLECH